MMWFSMFLVDFHVCSLVCLFSRGFNSSSFLLPVFLSVCLFFVLSVFFLSFFLSLLLDSLFNCVGLCFCFSRF